MTEAEAAAWFGALADILFPEAEGMPRASDATDLAAGLAAFLNGRPDLRPEVMRGLLGMASASGEAIVANLPAGDPDAWRALTLGAAWIYYGSTAVQSRLGYHGPERRTYDADAVPEYVANGMLDVVVRTGAIWRAADA